MRRSDINLVLMILASIFVLLISIHIAAKRAERYENTIRDEMLMQVTELANGISYRYFEKLAFDSSDYHNPVYELLCEQLSAFSEIAPYHGIYTMHLKDSVLVFGPESYPEGHAFASAPGTIFEQPDTRDFRVFYTAQPDVFGPITDEYGTFITALAPVINPASGQASLAIAIDMPYEKLNYELFRIRLLPIIYGFFLILLIVAAFVLLNRDNKSDKGISRKMLPGFTTIVAIIGITLTAYSTIMILGIERNNLNNSFKSQSALFASKIIDEFRSIGIYMKSTASFFQNSVEVDSNEFSSYASSLFDNRAVKAVYWLSAGGEKLHSYGLFTDKATHKIEIVYSRPSGYQKILEENLVNNRELHKAKIRAFSTGHISSALMTFKKEEEELKNAVFLLIPVFKNPANDPYNEENQLLEGFVVYLISLQEIMNNVVKYYNTIDIKINLGIIDVKPGGVYDFVAEFSASDREASVISLGEYTGYRHLTPALAFGRAMAIVSDNQDIYRNKTIFIYGLISIIIGVILTIIVTMFVAYSRKRQSELDQKVRHRTRKLNQRIKELNCIQEIGNEMQRINALDRICEKIIEYAAKGMEFPEQAYIKIEIDNQRFLSENFRQVYSNTVAYDITPFNTYRGRLTFCYNRDEALGHEERIFIEQVTRLLTTWLERNDVVSKLIEAKDKAEAGDRMKHNFINNISHEVRTPLSGIIGFAELITESGIADVERKAYVKQLNASIDRLINTINDYMDISLLNSGKLEFHLETFRLRSLMQNLYHTFVPQCEIKGLKLIFDLNNPLYETDIFTDSEFLRKAFFHLLTNAVKFTNVGFIEVGVSHDDDFLRFYVKDTGVGISTESDKFLFNKFWQEDMSDTRHFEGSGLGLPIAKGIIENLGGELTYESVKDKGSVFSFTIPRAASSEASDKVLKGKPVSKDDAEKKLILVAEDDDSNYFLLSVLLEKAMYEVIRAEDGYRAIEFCRNIPNITLVLMDIKMPVVNGLEATVRIKEFRPELPIIAITAYSNIADELKIRNAGFNDFLSKPYRIEEILSKISEYI